MDKNAFHALVRGRRSIRSFLPEPVPEEVIRAVLDDGVRTASDVGMFAQTLLLSLAAHGLAGVPQTYLGFYSQQVRDLLGVDPLLKLLFGISFGKPDMGSAASKFDVGRAPMDAIATFHG